MNVDDIVQQRIEAARRKTAAEKAARAAFAAARSKGLARRHAAKLQRQTQTREEAPGHLNPEPQPPTTQRPITPTYGGKNNHKSP